jgi:hypothetical protein
MKKFLKKLVIFILPALIYAILAIVAIPALLALQNGPSTEEQISYSFENAVKRDYELLILGNSRTYRGLDPEAFTYKAYNFSHDNDSFNQIYYKLKYLAANKKDFDYVILGMDYFQFSFISDTRNYVYCDYLGQDYLDDFEINSPFRLKMDYQLSNINPKKLSSIDINKLFSTASGNNEILLRENGQYIRPGKARKSDTIERDINRLDLQENYFKSILEFCRSREIPVVIVMLPVRENELKLYTESHIAEFRSFITTFTDNDKVFYLDYSTNKDYTLADYTDITHLNEKAANRFSKTLNTDVLKVLNKETKLREDGKYLTLSDDF